MALSNLQQSWRQVLSIKEHQANKKILTLVLMMFLLLIVFSSSLSATTTNNHHAADDPSFLNTTITVRKGSERKVAIVYSQSMNTQFVSSSDYPAGNVATFSSNLKLYWKLLKNEKSSDINDAILEFGAVAKNTRGYVSFCFGYLSGDPMKGDTIFGYYNSASQSVTIMDAWMVAKPQTPVSDASDDILQRNGGYNANTGETHIKWTRFVKTGDAYDVVFTNTAMKMSWALHSSNTGMVRHTSTGKGPSTNFLSAGYATGEYGVLPTQPVVSGGSTNSTNCSLPSGYSQSITTKWVTSSDYPVNNYKLVANYGTSDSLKLYWKVLTNPDNANNAIIEFGLVATGIYGYASIAFNHGSSGMQTADTMFGYVDSTGNVVIVDAYMQGNLQAPTVDASQDFISKNGGLRTVSGTYELHLKWTRLINTQDSADHTFSNAQIPISWALSKTSTSITSVHSYRDKNVMINFLQTAALTDLGVPPGSTLTASCTSSNSTSTLPPSDNGNTNTNTNTPPVTSNSTTSNSSACSLPSGYSQSITTKWVTSSDYPANNYKLVGSYGTSDSLKLYWKVLTNPSDSNAPIIEFGLIATGIYGYASIGFNHGVNSGMDTADTMFGYIDSNGNPVILDTYMQGNLQSPTVDSSQDFISKNGGLRLVNGNYELHLKWSRLVNTKDALDHTFSNAQIPISWALSKTSTSITSVHNYRDKNVMINFLQTATLSDLGVPPGSTILSGCSNSSSNSTSSGTTNVDPTPAPPTVSNSTSSNSSSCSLPSGYSQSITTKWVTSSDYPANNYKLVASYGASDSLKLYWKVLTNSNDASSPIIEFGLIATGIYGYASLGFNHGSSSGMQTADTMFGYVDSNGNPVILDTYMQGNLQAPTQDSSQDFISKNGGLRSVNGNYELHLKWTRLVNTKDALDHVFTNAQIPVSWAVAKTSTSMDYVHNYRGKSVMINFLQTATLADLAAPPGSELATCGSLSGNIKDGTISMNSLMKIANSYRWHLMATALVCGLLVIGGMLLSVIGPRVNPNLFLDLILYRRLTKQVNLKFIGIYINTVLDLTLGEAIVISCYWILVAIWFAFGYVNATSAEAGKAFASVCVFNFGLILFPVTRYSVLQVLFGISFDRAIKYHRWLGILQWFFVTAHGIAMVVHYNTSGLYLVDITSPTFPILGIIAWFFMTILWLMTFPVIRRKLWEFFLISHVILSILIVILSIIHGSGYINLLPYMALSILLYLFDVFLRATFGFGVPTKIDSMKYDEKSQITTITMRKPFLTFGSNPSMGHFIFLYIPAVSKYQHHPITVSSCKGVDGGMIKKKELEFTVHVKNFGSGWSKQVAKVAQEKGNSANELFCRVEGAYGSLSVPLLKYETIVMFGGGIGITPVHSIYSHLLEKNVQYKTVYTCWSIPTSDMIQAFPQLLRNNGHKNFKPNIFISKMKEETSNNSFIHKGRANPKQFLEKVKKEMKERGISNGYVGVLVCGPEQLVTSVSNAIWDENERNGIRFHLHKEVFTW